MAPLTITQRKIHYIGTVYTGIYMQYQYITYGITYKEHSCGQPKHACLLAPEAIFLAPNWLQIQTQGTQKQRKSLYWELWRKPMAKTINYGNLHIGCQHCPRTRAVGVSNWNVKLSIPCCHHSWCSTIGSWSWSRALRSTSLAVELQVQWGPDWHWMAIIIPNWGIVIKSFCTQ